MAIAPASTDQKAAKEEARAASLEFKAAREADLDADENRIQDQIQALEASLGPGSPSAAQQAQFDKWDAELNEINNKRRVIIFLDFSTLPSRAKVNSMLAKVQAVRTQLQSEKAAVAGIVDKVKRIQTRIDQAGKVIATLTKLATLVV